MFSTMGPIGSLGLNKMIRLELGLLVPSVKVSISNTFAYFSILKSAISISKSKVSIA